MNTVGDRIRSARLAKGWSAEKLANEVGYATQSGIANLENRKTGSGGHRIKLIAKKLDVSVDWLLNGDDHEHVRFGIRTVEPSTSNRVAEMPQHDYMDDLREELLELWSHLSRDEKIEWIGDLKRFMKDRQLRHDGQALHVAAG